MLDYVYGQDDIVAGFVAQMIPTCSERGFGRCKTVGVIDQDGKLIAGIVYHNYDPDAGIIEISGAALPGKVWLTRETIKRMYQYPFLQLRCQMVVQRNSADDERLLFMLSRYGYAFVPVPRMWGRDKDGVLCLLTSEAWADNKFNQRFRHHLMLDKEFAEAAE
jgi:RimJ/RimL family protein N-acetyltransferase